MCMQDLVINRSLTWRPVVNITDSDTGGSIIPPNPRRVALTGKVLLTNGGIAFSITQQPPILYVNEIYDNAGAGSLTPSVVNIRDYPGIFNGPIYAQDRPSDIVVYEAVMDEPLDRAVQSEYEKLVGR